MEEYYYNQLNRTGREAYHAILTGLKSLSPSFRIPLLENKELTEIYFSVRMDHPEIFYTVEFKYRYHNGAEYGEMMPVYLSDRKKIPAQEDTAEKENRGRSAMRRRSRSSFSFMILSAETSGMTS